MKFEKDIVNESALAITEDTTQKQMRLLQGASYQAKIQKVAEISKDLLDFYLQNRSSLRNQYCTGTTSDFGETSRVKSIWINFDIFRSMFGAMQ
mmetsp:Transcript_23938/g.35142  ORF Transcript_23938/g.35142 Transcript_23938/m.35142 type:complete len:94 (+) Transcript_23938:299-580(+)